ncbi:hypothetical protein ACZ87_01514 [Candidatus Erwinia dacicola]|uniref:Uncharacterized protein n=1 Tax=Candidatus Erwinia dacicola TaxID=252393 RepID=A0A328TRY1_9GAMM|nr:hypothetical protein ACZ87_01514 [Candidatus Erwinia dacicola]
MALFVPRCPLSLFPIFADLFCYAEKKTAVNRANFLLFDSVFIYKFFFGTVANILMS